MIALIDFFRYSQAVLWSGAFHELPKPRGPCWRHHLRQPAFNDREVLEIIRQALFSEDGLDDREPARCTLEIQHGRAVVVGVDDHFPVQLLADTKPVERHRFAGEVVLAWHLGSFVLHPHDGFTDNRSGITRIGNRRREQQCPRNQKSQFPDESLLGAFDVHGAAFVSCCENNEFTARLLASPGRHRSLFVIFPHPFTALHTKGNPATFNDGAAASLGESSGPPSGMLKSAAFQSMLTSGSSQRMHPSDSGW